MPIFAADRVIEGDELAALGRTPGWTLCRAVLSATPADPEFVDDAAVRAFLVEQLGAEHVPADAEILLSDDLEREDGDHDFYIAEMEISADAAWPFEPFVRR